LGGQLPREQAFFGPVDARELVSTITEENLRSVLRDPQPGQRGFNPAEYSDIVARISKDSAHCWQT
jgi:hypothetical protein